MSVALILLAGQPVLAQPLPKEFPPLTPVAAPAEPDAIPLYGASTPGRASSEVWARDAGKNHVVRNVTRPTLTPILPDPAKATGAAVVVAPGGGFMSLALEHEGWRVARALADRGIAAFVLKYRLLPTPADPAESARHIVARMTEAFSTPAGPDSLYNPDAASDAVQALRLIRASAKTWNLDPQRLGMIGFSAGARTTLKVVLTAPPADRPAYFGYIYGDLSARPVPTDAPPMFAAIAFDDQLYPKGNVALAQAWHAAKRPVELHVYQTGGHGFGSGLPGTTTTQVIDEFVSWMRMQRFLETKKD